MKANKTLIKSVAFILVLCCTVLQLRAQESLEVKPSTLVFHAFYYDFNTTQWRNLADMQMGFGLNYLKGITKNIDVAGTLDESYTDYVFKHGTTNGSSQFLLDGNIGLNFKLLTDNHTLVPYLFGGIGASTYKGNIGLYVPVGVGVQINLFNQAFIFPTAQYRSAVSSTVNNHIQYAIGIGTSIGKKKKAKVIPPPAIIPPVAKPAEPVKVSPPPAEVKIIIKDFVVTVTDSETGLPLPNVDVVINGPDGKINAITNTKGQATFTGLKAADYKVNGTLNGINTTSQQIAKSSFDTGGQQIAINISHSDPRFTLTVKVHDKSVNHTTGGVLIDVVNNTQNNTINGQTQLDDSTYSIQLPANSDFTISGKKAGYISNIEKVSTKGLNRSTTLYVKLELAIEEALRNKTISLKNIYYDTGSAEIRASASSDLEKLVKFLKDNPAITIEIDSHTDSRGSKAVNLKLSQARAQQVVSYLQKNGIDKSRLVAKGYGATRLVNGCTIGVKCTDAQHEQNRRTEFKVISN